MKRARTMEMHLNCCLVVFLSVLVAGTCSSTIRPLPDIYWNSSNPIFRMDNTDHVLTVNVLDTLRIRCARYNDTVLKQHTEQSIIYRVSKTAYDTCTIDRQAQPIGRCQDAYRSVLIKHRIRTFSPLPNGVEYTPGQSYYFISTSSGQEEGLEDKYGGLCLTAGMRLRMNVLCEAKNKNCTNQFATENNYEGSHNYDSVPDAAPKSRLTPLEDGTMLLERVEDARPRWQQHVRNVPSVNDAQNTIKDQSDAEGDNQPGDKQWMALNGHDSFGWWVPSDHIDPLQRYGQQKPSRNTDTVVPGRRKPFPNAPRATAQVPRIYDGRSPPPQQMDSESLSHSRYDTRADRDRQELDSAWQAIEGDVHSYEQAADNRYGHTDHMGRPLYEINNVRDVSPNIYQLPQESDAVRIHTKGGVGYLVLLILIHVLCYSCR